MRLSRVTPASEHLRTLARLAAEAYVTHAPPRAILLTGSAAQGVSDFASDVKRET